MVKEGNVKMVKVGVPKEMEYTLWFNRHTDEIKKYAGRWIALRLGIGVVGVGDNPQEAAQNFRKKYPKGKMLLYQVPRPDEGNYVLSS